MSYYYVFKFNAHYSYLLTFDFIQVSAAQLRSSTSHNLPIKVKGYVGHFLVDMRGEIKNSPLLDATLGLKRNLK